MSEEKLNRYSLEQAGNEAQSIRAAVESGKASNYQEAEKSLEENKRKTFQEELIKPVTEENSESFSEDNMFLYYAKSFGLPQDLIEEVHQARLTYALQKLKVLLSAYKENPGISEEREMISYVGHILKDLSGTSRKSRGYKDIASDFLQCYEVQLETFGRESKPREALELSPWISSIESIINKYSVDERFNKNSLELKANIAKKLSDFAKSK